MYWKILIMWVITKNYNRLELVFHDNMSVILQLTEFFFVVFDPLLVIVFSDKLTKRTLDIINVKKLYLDHCQCLRKNRGNLNVYFLFHKWSLVMKRVPWLSLVEMTSYLYLCFRWVCRHGILDSPVCKLWDFLIVSATRLHSA